METLLKQIITSPDLLRQGDTLIQQALKQPQNRKALLQLFYLCENRNYIILVQNVYPNLWDTLSSQEKQITRQSILKMMHQKYKHPKDIEALAIFVNKIHNIEGYDNWVPLYQQLIRLGLSPQLMEYLLVIYRNQDDRISTINATLIKQLINNLQISNDAIVTEKLMILLYYVVRSSVSLQGVDDEKFNIIMTKQNSSWLVGVYKNILTSDQTHLHKLVLQQLTVIFSQASTFALSIFSSTINLIWMYFNNLVPIYINQNVLTAGQQKPRSSVSDEYIFGRFEQQITLSQGLVYQGLQLIQSIFLNKTMKKLMKFAIYPLLAVMNSLLLITKRDEKQWIQQQNKFIADTQDQDIIGIRNRIISFINILVQDRYKGTIDILKLIINNAFENGSLSSLKQLFQKSIIERKIMQQLDSKITSQSQQLQQIFDKSFVNIEVSSWLLKETATLLLHSFASNILSTIPEKNILFQKLRIEVESSPHVLLKIQSLNTLVRCAQQIQAELLPNFLNYSINSLNSRYLGLQVISVKAIGTFIRKLRLSPIQTNHIKIQQQHIQKISGLIDSFSSETIHVFLDTAIELIKFSNQSKQLTIKYIEKLVPRFVQISLTDGLFASQLIELLGAATSLNIQQFLFSKLQQTLNIKGYEQITELCLRILETNLQNQIFYYQNTIHINQFILKNINNTKIQSLIRQLLRNCIVSKEVLQQCVRNIKPSWFIPLHQKGITLDITSILKQSVEKIIQLISPSEVQQQLTLPFYVMWSNYTQTMNLIKSFGLYDQFVTKWLRYQQTFKGAVLKKVSIVLASNLQQPIYKQQVNELIARQKNFFLNQKQLISKLQPQWQDESGDDNQNQKGFGGLDIDEDGWFQGDLVNRIVQKQLISAIKGIEEFSIQELISKRIV